MNDIQSVLSRSYASREGVDNRQSKAFGAEQFLHCHIHPDTGILFSIFQLAEILNIPVEQITPIPELPSWVMGVYNWRGEVLWLVDLGDLIGLTPCHQSTSYTATYSTVILQSSGNETGSLAPGLMLGIVVSQVQDIEWVNPDDLQSPPASAITPALAPFLRGYWLKSSADIFLCLDVDAVFSAMPQAKQ